MNLKILTLVMLLGAATTKAEISSARKPLTDADWNAFLSAIAQVESNGRTDLKVLDTNGRYSYGCLQIQNPYLVDSGADYTLENLYDQTVSFEVAKRYLTRYGRSYEKRTGKTATYEVLARIHNGGPRGAERKATEGYWAKVKAKLGN